MDSALEDEDIESVRRRLKITPDRIFAPYGLNEADIAELRRKLAAWPG